MNYAVDIFIFVTTGSGPWLEIWYGFWAWEGLTHTSHGSFAQLAFSPEPGSRSPKHGSEPGQENRWALWGSYCAKILRVMLSVSVEWTIYESRIKYRIKNYKQSTTGGYELIISGLLLARKSIVMGTGKKHVNSKKRTESTLYLHNTLYKFEHIR